MTSPALAPVDEDPPDFLQLVSHPLRWRLLRELDASGLPTAVAKGGRYALVLLALTQAMSLLDRQILSILLEPIRKDLVLSDTQLGLLSGLAFAIFVNQGWPLAGLARTILFLQGHPSTFASHVAREIGRELKQAVRDANRPSPSASTTRSRVPLRITALRGMCSTAAPSAATRLTVASMFGRTSCGGASSTMRARTVRVSMLSSGYTYSTRPWTGSPGCEGKRTSACVPCLTHADCDSGTSATTSLKGLQISPPVSLRAKPGTQQ